MTSTRPVPSFGERSTPDGARAVGGAGPACPGCHRCVRGPRRSSARVLRLVSHRSPPLLPPLLLPPRTRSPPLPLLPPGASAAAASSQRRCSEDMPPPSEGHASPSGCAKCTPDGATCLECGSHHALAANGTCVRCRPPGDFWMLCGSCEADAPDVCTGGGGGLAAVSIRGLFQLCQPGCADPRPSAGCAPTSALQAASASSTAGMCSRHMAFTWLRTAPARRAHGPPQAATLATTSTPPAPLAATATCWWAPSACPGERAAAGGCRGRGLGMCGAAAGVHQPGAGSLLTPALPLCRSTDPSCVRCEGSLDRCVECRQDGSLPGVYLDTSNHSCVPCAHPACRYCTATECRDCTEVRWRRPVGLAWAGVRRLREQPRPAHTPRLPEVSR